MSGSGNIYRLKPVFEIPQKILLPNCMYRLNNPVAQVTNAIDFEKKESAEDVLANIMDKEPVPELSELEIKWDGIIKQLLQLKSQLVDIRKTVAASCRLTGYSLVDTATLNNLKTLQGAVINASPSNPPFSLLLLRHLYRSSVPIIFITHIHSNVSNFPEHLKLFDDSNTHEKEKEKSFNIHLIWKNGLLDTELIINPLKQLPIKGEVNILKIFASYGLTLLQYPSDDILKTTQIDSSLDLCHRLVHSRASKERTSICRGLNGRLGRQQFFGGDKINIVDVSAWSILKQVFDKVEPDLTPNILKWYKKIDQFQI